MAVGWAIKLLPYRALTLSLEGPWDSPHPVFSPCGLVLLQREPVLITAPNHQQLSLDTNGGGQLPTHLLPAGLLPLPQPPSPAKGAAGQDGRRPSPHPNLIY